MAKATKPKVAVIIPVYNPPHDWWVNTLEHMLLLRTLCPQYDFSFTVVNDGSPAWMFKELDAAAHKAGVPYTRVSHKQNFGKGRALKTGVGRISADYYVCVDWDFPFGSYTIKDVLAELEAGSQVVVLDRGVEYLRALPYQRAIITQFWRIFVQSYLHLGVPDTQAGTKGFDKTAAKYFLGSSIDGFMHDTEFIYRARVNGLRIKAIPVHLRTGIKLKMFSLKTYKYEFQLLQKLLKMIQDERKKRIIVNADDFGMDRRTNYAIKRGIQSSVVTSVSVMVNMPAFEDAVQFLKKHPQVEVGLHFNITEGRPDRYGLFQGLIRTAWNILTSRTSMTRVATELEIQYTKLKDTGLHVTHLDSHEHIHLLLPVYKMFIRFAEKNRISRVRHCKSKVSDLTHSINLRYHWKRFAILIFYNFNYHLHKRKIDQMPTTYLQDISWLRHPSMANWVTSLDRLSYGQTEIICHAQTIPFVLDYKVVAELRKNKIWFSHS